MTTEKKARRHVVAVVTEESITKEIDFVLSHLVGAEGVLMPATSEEERRRRQAIVREAANRMFVAGLLSVKTYQPRQYSALATAAIRYIHEKIGKGTAAFTVQKPRGPKAFWEWMLGTSALATYNALVQKLREAWKHPIIGPLRALPPRAPTSRRYGVKQHIAGQLYHRQRAAGIRAVQELGKSRSTSITPRRSNQT